MNSTFRNRPLVLLTALVGALSVFLVDGAFAGDSNKYEATFTEDGQLIRPAGWRGR